MGAIISAAIANIINFLVKYHLATKIILSVLFITVLPIVLWNLIYDLMSVVFSVVQSFLPSYNLSLSLLGTACWFFHVLKLPEALSVVISASITRMVLSMIPFIGVK
jgi:hypothetical protein